MKKRLLLTNIFVVCLLFTSCKKDNNETESNLDVQNNSKNKILVLGASRVEGNKPEFESFRYELWKLLKTDNLSFDFIGTLIDEVEYSSFNGESFDPDHEGHSTLTARDINDDINSWLKNVGKPDMVLFSSPGGNDALENLSYEGTISAINEIIDKLQANNPNITIFIEEIAPAHSFYMVGDLENYFDKFRTDIPLIASQQSNETSKVITIDMNTGFNDTHLADEVHYNENGAKFIANRYYHILKDYIK